MGSRLLSFACSSYDSSQFQLSKMEAIKKKMQAMKVEKDNACDRVDASEEQCKAARLRASKAEDEVDELVTKSRQLETELDLTTEKLGIATLQLKEKQLSATELEMAALNRRVSGLEEDLEKTEEKMVAAVAKLDKAATASDDSERAKKVFQSKADEDEKRITALEKELKEAREKAEAADNHYDEVAKKLATCESELEKAEERADVGETKILEQEVDRLEDELVSEQEKYKAITEELEQTFAEMSGYYTSVLTLAIPFFLSLATDM